MTAFPDLKIYVNGSFVPADQPCISAFDRGFLYGDTVFEGIREYGGKVFKLTEHIDRLFRSAKIMAMTIPLARRICGKDLGHAQDKWSQDASYQASCFKRPGPAGPENSSPVVILPILAVLSWWRAFRENGLVRKIGRQFRSEDKVHRDHVNGVMAKIEANAAGCDEALPLTGKVTLRGPGSTSMFGFYPRGINLF